MKTEQITPALNAEILKEVENTFNTNSNVTKAQFTKAFKKAVEKRGFNYNYYQSVMRQLAEITPDDFDY